MAANRKQDLRIRNLGVQKQNRIPFLTGTPGPSVGRDGDMQIRLVPRKGLYLFYKHGNEWYGTKMEKFIKKVRDGNQVILPNAPTGQGHHNLEEGELTWSGENIMIYHGKSKGLVEINKKGDKDYKISGGVIKDTSVDVSKKTLTMSSAQKQDIAGNFVYSDLVSVGATANADLSIGNFEIHAGRIKLSQAADAEGVLGYNSSSGVFEMQDGSSKQNVMVHDPTTGLVKRTRSAGSSDIIFDTDNLTLQDSGTTSIETKFSIDHLATSAKTSVKLWEDIIKIQSSNPTSISDFQNHPMVYAVDSNRLYFHVGSKAKYEELSDGLDFTYDVTSFSFNGSVTSPQEIGGTLTPVGGSAPDGYWKAAGALAFDVEYQNGPPTSVTITATGDWDGGSGSGWTDGGTNALTVAGSGATSQLITSDQNLKYPDDYDDTITFAVTTNAAPDDGTYPTNLSVQFKNAIKYGSSSSNSSLTDINLNTLGSKALSDNENRTIANVSTGSSQYFIYTYPARLGNLDGEYDFRHDGLTAGFTKEVLNHINAFGYQESYNIYIHQIANVSSGTFQASSGASLVNNIFYGKHGDSSISNSDLITLSSVKSSDTTRNLGNITTGAGEYLVYSYDEDHTDLAAFRITLDGYTAGFTQQSTSNYQNPAGRTSNYKSYVSNITNPTSSTEMVWRTDAPGFVYERKWGFIAGVSDPAAFSSANFKNLVNSTRNQSTVTNDNTDWGTHTCGTTERLVLCIPSSLTPDIDIDEDSTNEVLFGGVSCGFNKASSVTLVNDYGYSSPYDIYISKRTNMNKGASGDLDIKTTNSANNEHIWGLHTESATSITELTSDELYGLTEGAKDDTEGNYNNVRVIQSSMNVEDDEFITYAYDDAGSDLTTTKFHFGGITMGISKLSSDVNYMNRNGYSADFKVYVADASNLGTGNFEYKSSSAIVNQICVGKINLGSSWSGDLSTDLPGYQENTTTKNVLNSVGMNQIIDNTYNTEYDYGTFTTDSTNWFVFGYRNTGNAALNANQFQLQVDPSDATTRITMGMEENATNPTYTHTNTSGYRETYKVWISKTYGYNEGNEWRFWLDSSSAVKNQYFNGWIVDSAETPGTVTESDLNTGTGISIAYDEGNTITALAETTIAATTNKRIVFAVADARIGSHDSSDFRFNGFTIGMTAQTLSNFTNPAGFQEDYSVWISNDKSVGTGGFEFNTSFTTLNQIRIGKGTDATPTADSDFIDTLINKIDITYNNNLNYAASGSAWYITGLDSGGQNQYIYFAAPRRHGWFTSSNQNSFQWKPASGSDYGQQVGYAKFNCLTTGGAISWTNANGFTEDYDVFVSAKPAGTDMGTSGRVGKGTSTLTYRQVYYGTSTNSGLTAAQVAGLSGRDITTDPINNSGSGVSMNISSGSSEYVYFSCMNVEPDVTVGTDYSSSASGTSFTYDGLTMGVKAKQTDVDVVGAYGHTATHDTYQSEGQNLRGGATCAMKVYTAGNEKLINRWYYGAASSSHTDVSGYNNAQLAAFLSELVPVTLSNGTVLTDFTNSLGPGENNEVFTSTTAGVGEYIWHVYPTRYKTSNGDWFNYFGPPINSNEGGFGGYGSYANGEGHVGNFTNDVGWTESYVFVRSANSGLGAAKVRITT